ncbi:transcription factor [Ganoderma sinense ZZ0214-1]|uniref:Transcription factor n=1 Tax=Ganoderma sinense ZZ0214-1 TaxID=1077348 RepID=A0A2G8S1F2_9APHY|nr:transcription factor [Ganoderma sinense ZZ0214-1]
MAANVNFCTVHYHNGTYYSNREGMPTPLVQDAAWNLATSTYMHGREHIPALQSLPPSTHHHHHFTEELHESHYNPFYCVQDIVAAAPAPGAFFPFSTPSAIRSPTYPEGDIKPKVENMENIQSTSPYAIYAPPLPTPGTDQRMRCQWQNCPIDLDDVSHAGIRRHFRDYHSQARGSTVRCEWGGTCRSEEMLYDNIAKHIAECHLKSMRTRCESCGNTFARNDTLKRHLNAGCPALQGHQG